jgi:hypothetical protein
MEDIRSRPVAGSGTQARPSHRRYIEGLLNHSATGNCKLMIFQRYYGRSVVLVLVVLDLVLVGVVLDLVLDLDLVTTASGKEISRFPIGRFSAIQSGLFSF